jgi:hypothetical protein
LQAATAFQPERLDFEGPEAEWRSAAFARIAKLRTGAAGFLKVQNQRLSVPGRFAG